ncbi:MAG: cation diffusion facilitator transporter [Candidatus Improbicoccus devescovinae]|nr:MAG: cation diffusion facilitator transporter [Candidatus Improbicoccus devescovinae]
MFNLNDFLIHKFIGKNIDATDNKIRKKSGILSGVFGIILNLLLFSSKLMIGIFSFSIATMADAFNNLSDAGSSIITFICFKTASTPPDKEHPFGHGRIEYVSGLIVSIAIILTGLSFIKTSIERIFKPEEIVIDILSILILSISIIIKLWMGFFNHKISKLINSSAIQATANDSFMDSIATSTVILGIVTTKLTGFYLDPYAGLIVSVFIVLTGTKTLKESLDILLGKAPEPELIEKINNCIKDYPEILEITNLMVHNYGPGWSVITFKAKVLIINNDIYAANEIIENLEQKLETKLRCQAVIRLQPVINNSQK